MSVSNKKSVLKFKVRVLFLFYLFSVFFWLPHWASAAKLETANVMAPLYVSDAGWDKFEEQLDSVRDYGVSAVSVDVWWGAVEGTKDNKFDWSYYDKIFSIIKKHNLKIVPILSFHQCGGNVGDDCNIPLPSWLWTKYLGKIHNGMQINKTDLKFKSEQGNYSDEAVQGWLDDLVANEYTDFVNDFKKNFASYNIDIIEINVSAGPSGELRYPSYNSHDDCSGYPHRGRLQAYSRFAIESFRREMLKKHGGLGGINSAWGTDLKSIAEVRPPDNTDYFFSSKDYSNIQYGRDFVDWYNQSLVNHGRILITNVINSLGESFPNAKIGFKIPGVHWAMADSKSPRAAEVAAGLIQTSVDFNSDSTGHGYAKIVGLAKELSTTGRDIVLHFTCLEKKNEEGHPDYSQAESLVFWVAKEAKHQGVVIKGENALACGITNNDGWNNIENVFNHSSYSGFTALRIGNVTAGTGRDRYKKLINDFSRKGFRSERGHVQ